MYTAWMYIGLWIRHIRPYYSIYIYHISLYRFLSEIAGRKDECRTSLITFRDRWNYDVVLSPPFSWTNIVLSLGRFLRAPPLNARVQNRDVRPSYP